MIKAVIFDCFGVLYPDPTGLFYEKHKHLFGNSSDYLDKLNLEIDLGKITKDEFFAKLEAEIGMPSDEIKAWMDNTLVQNLELIEFIKKLKKKYKVGLISNAGQEEIAIVYKDKIDNLFDEITVSSKEKILKPNKEIFLRCVQRLDVKPVECVFIDDNKVNTLAAQKLRIETIVYRNFDDFYSKFNDL